MYLNHEKVRPINFGWGGRNYVLSAAFACTFFLLRLHFASSSDTQHVMCLLLRLHFASSSNTQQVMCLFLLRLHFASSSVMQHLCVCFLSLLFESCCVVWSSQHNSVHVCMGAMVTSIFLVLYNFQLLRLVRWCWNILFVENHDRVALQV